MLVEIKIYKKDFLVFFLFLNLKKGHFAALSIRENRLCSFYFYVMSTLLDASYVNFNSLLLPNVSYHQVEKFKKRETLIETLKDVGTDRTLVFVETKKNADFLACILSNEGFPTTYEHITCFHEFCNYEYKNLFSSKVVISPKI